MEENEELVKITKEKQRRKMITRHAQRIKEENNEGGEER
jgi:hypothetical protein